MEIYIKPENQRPDYRLVITWLWSDSQNVDTCGNSTNPASRDWTELYISNREEKNEIVDIFSISETPLILEIKGSNSELIYRAAYFLSMETGGKIFKDKELKEEISRLEIESGMGDFNVQEAIERTNKSIWKKSTLKTHIQIWNNSMR